MRFPLLLLLIASTALLNACAAPGSGGTWSVASQDQWNAAQADADGVAIADGLATSVRGDSRFSSTVQRFDRPRRVASVVFRQTTAWDNWSEIPNVGPDVVTNAQVLLPVKDGDYWLFGQHTDYKRANNQKNLAADPRPRLSPEVKEALGGYHAWHSTDMQTWEHRGPITTHLGRWMTTAEYADGAFYFYFDNPNDQDPHLMVDHDAGDGVPGTFHGMALDDPTHGSDAGVIRDDDGTFHLIFEDWSYNNPRTHAWDAPTAGHAVSPDGLPPFRIQERFAVDERTTPTGETGTYTHSSSTSPLEYAVHDPEQNAYGDWTAIKVGGRYYLFCDYDPVGEKIRIGRFTSPSLDETFTFCGSFGGGHPDPTVGFAEGRFYLVQQRGAVDYASPGPWVPGVEARGGVDTTGDGAIDTWTDWQGVAERYAQKPGFARIVETTPATLDVRGLPPGRGFAFEYRTTEHDDRHTDVVMDAVEVTFE